MTESSINKAIGALSGSPALLLAAIIFAISMYTNHLSDERVVEYLKTRDAANEEALMTILNCTRQNAPDRMTSPHP